MCDQIRAHLTYIIPSVGIPSSNQVGGLIMVQVSPPPYTAITNSQILTHIPCIIQGFRDSNCAQILQHGRPAPVNSNGATL